MINSVYVFLFSYIIYCQELTTTTNHSWKTPWYNRQQTRDNDDVINDEDDDDDDEDDVPGVGVVVSVAGQLVSQSTLASVHYCHQIMHERTNARTHGSQYWGLFKL